MEITKEEKEKIIKYCKGFIARHGSVRVGWAIEQIVGYKPLTHVKEKIANTIIQSGEYLKEQSAKKYDDWNIYKNPEHNRISLIDKVNLGLGIFSIIGVIISILISIWGIQTTKNIAKESGAFDKGIFQLSFGGYFVSPDIDFDVYYGVDFSDTSLLNFATLPFGVHNFGKKTIDNANMIIKYPHIANIAVNDSLIEFNAFSTEPIERKFSTVEPYDQVIIKFNSMNPNYSIEAGELICLRGETMFKHIFPVTTKDSHTINLSTSLKYAYPVTVGLTAKDIITAQYNFIINYRKETDFEKLIDKVIQEKISQKEDSLEGSKNFFVIIPTQTKSIGKGNNKVAFLNSNSSNTLLCQFDKEMKTVAIMNQDGNIQRIINITTQ